MNRRDDDEGIPPILQDAYDAASDTADPSDLLWTRTLRELRRRGMLRAVGGPARSRGWIAAVLVGLAFLGGYAAGRESGPASASTYLGPPAAPAGDPMHDAELVQAASTDYVFALEMLGENLDGASATDIATARAVLRSAAEAQAEPTRRLLLPPEPETPAGEAMVWF